MSTTEISPADDRITLVLRAGKVESLDNFRKNAKLGGIVMIDSSVAYIAGLSEGDLQMVLDQERDERWMQAQLQEEALGAPAHLAAHAQEMFDLLRRIDAKCGGLDAALGHGIEPSEQMWTESREAMEAIWELQDKIQSAASVDTVRANQTTQNQGSLITGNPIVAQSPYSEVRVKNIDVWIRTLENAKRYEWLRDAAFDTPRQDLVPRDKSGNMLIEQDLDSEIDQAMKAYPGEQEVEPCAD